MKLHIFCICIRGDHGSRVDSTRILHVLDLELDEKICEKPNPSSKSLFIFGIGMSLRSLYKFHFLSINIGEFQLHRWLPEFEQESDSQI